MTDQPTQIVAYEYQARLPVRDRATLKNMLTTYTERLAASVPASSLVTVQTLIDSACLAFAKNSALQNCTQESVLTSIFDAARFGLDCSGRLNSAHLVPYKTTCQLIIGYGGLMDLAKRAADVMDLDCQLVYEGDQIDMRLGTDPHIDHRPLLTGTRDPKDIQGAYCVASLKGGKRKVEYMTRTELDTIRGRSRAGRSGPWVSDTGEMARKTVIRRMVKYLSTSVVDANRSVLVEAVQHDERTSGFDTSRTDAATDADRTAALKDKLGEKSSADYAQEAAEACAGEETKQ